MQNSVVTLHNLLQFLETTQEPYFKTKYRFLSHIPFLFKNNELL